MKRIGSVIECEVECLQTDVLLFCFSTLFMAISVDFSVLYYRNDPKFSDRYAWANSPDPDQTAQSLHCLPFRLYRLDSLLYGRAT